MLIDSFNISSLIGILIIDVLDIWKSLLLDNIQKCNTWFNYGV